MTENNLPRMVPWSEVRVGNLVEIDPDLAPRQVLGNQTQLSDSEVYVTFGDGSNQPSGGHQYPPNEVVKVVGDSMKMRFNPHAFAATQETMRTLEAYRTLAEQGYLDRDAFAMLIPQIAKEWDHFTSLMREAGF
jgi:hypothetical protein